MEAKYLGSEQVTEEDRAYNGSRFSEVRDAIFANPYQKVWSGEDEPALPTYEVTLLSVLRGILPFGRAYQFRQAAERAIDSNADLRWGAEGKGFRRLLHPNGVCLTGLWFWTAWSHSKIRPVYKKDGYVRLASRRFCANSRPLIPGFA